MDITEFTPEEATLLYNIVARHVATLIVDRTTVSIETLSLYLKLTTIRDLAEEAMS